MHRLPKFGGSARPPAPKHSSAVSDRPAAARPRKTLDERYDGNRRRAPLVGAAHLSRDKGPKPRLDSSLPSRSPGVGVGVPSVRWRGAKKNTKSLLACNVPAAVGRREVPAGAQGSSSSCLRRDWSKP